MLQKEYGTFHLIAQKIIKTKTARVLLGEKENSLSSRKKNLLKKTKIIFFEREKKSFGLAKF